MNINFRRQGDEALQKSATSDMKRLPSHSSNNAVVFSLTISVLTSFMRVAAQARPPSLPHCIKH